MALYAPVSLIVLPVIWLILVLIGYMGIYLAAGVHSVRSAFLISGSSLLTLGFAASATCGAECARLLRGGDRLDSRRAPDRLSTDDVRGLLAAGDGGDTPGSARGHPAVGGRDVLRFHRLGQLDALADLWPAWEIWFAELEETHTSLAALAFFRSPQPHHSWVTAAGAMLDGAALYPRRWNCRPIHADACLRAGFIALRRIADFFDPHNAKPQPGDPISVSRAEYDAAVARLAAGGVPLKADREQAWRDFAGWRVNYDTVLILLAGLTKAPPAPWSSDRATRPRIQGCVAGGDGAQSSRCALIDRKGEVDAHRHACCRCNLS